MLPNILPGWQVRYLADGVALSPPPGVARGGMRIRERIQPLARARDVVATARDQMAGFGALTVSPLETFPTCEGEYAAVCTIAATGGPRPYERTIGLVWGDYAYTQIDGGTDDDAAFAQYRQGVRDLTYYHALGLGEQRRRRFAYAPPPGWRGYPRGLITEWYAPGFPADHGFISVFPARAGGDTAAAELDRLLHEMSWFGFARDALDEPEPIGSDDGLTGHAWRPVGRFGTGPTLHFEVAVLHDDRFTYVLRLESDDAGLAGHRDAFAAMIRSVRHLPVPAPATGTSPFLHLVT
ncbi:MAG: hypothetical protein H6708_28160 [Kofleriaceae bacterium]|nr:hypothetical protein [Myxococcales bacterium]MCB9564276.1 hypothetical protein [Kofleriaceae bacterium]